MAILLSTSAFGSTMCSHGYVYIYIYIVIRQHCCIGHRFFVKLSPSRFLVGPRIKHMTLAFRRHSGVPKSINTVAGENTIRPMPIHRMLLDASGAVRFRFHLTHYLTEL